MSSRPNAVPADVTPQRQWNRPRSLVRNPLSRLRSASANQAAPFFFSSSRITRRSFFSSGSLRSCLYSRKALLIIV